MRHYFWILAALMIGINYAPLQAQVVQSMWHANHVGSRTPGKIPEESVVVTLPGIYTGLYNSGFSYNDLVASTNNNVYTLDVDQVLSKLDKQNTFDLSGGLQTLGVGFKVGKLWLEMGHQIRFENSLFYPGDLLGVALRGNAAYIGQTADLGVRINSFNYSEFYAGAAFEVGKLQFGGRIKWLNGASAARTERNKLDLFTSDDVYQLTLESDYLLYTSPELDVLKGESNDFQIGSGDYDFSKMITRNRGLAFDLGIHYSLNDRIQFDASVMDIGSITWSEDLKGYASNKSIQYDGFVFDDLFVNDSLSFVGALDTLEELLGFEEVNAPEFKTRLPWYYQVGMRYDLNDWLALSGHIFGQQRESTDLTGFSLGSRFKVWKVLETGITYTYFNQTFDNIGGHLLLKLGPVRIFGASDNLISMFLPDDSRTLNGRAGLQLAF